MREDNGIILIPTVRWNKTEVTGTGVLDSDLGKKKVTIPHTSPWIQVQGWTEERRQQIRFFFIPMLGSNWS